MNKKKNIWMNLKKRFKNISWRKDNSCSITSFRACGFDNHYFFTDENARQAFVPPKPKEFERTKFTS